MSTKKSVTTITVNSPRKKNRTSAHTSLNGSGKNSRPHWKDASIEDAIARQREELKSQAEADTVTKQESVKDYQAQFAFKLAQLEEQKRKQEMELQRKKEEEEKKKREEEQLKRDNEREEKERREREENEKKTAEHLAFIQSHFGRTPEVIDPSDNFEAKSNVGSMRTSSSPSVIPRANVETPVVVSRQSPSPSPSHKPVPQSSSFPMDFETNLLNPVDERSLNSPVTETKSKSPNEPVASSVPSTPSTPSTKAQDTVPSDSSPKEQVDYKREFEKLRREMERDNERRLKAQQRRAELSSAKKDLSFKVIIVGPIGVGKSCLLVQLIQQVFNSSTSPTLFCEKGEHFVRIDDKLVELVIWDTAGQESFNSLGGTYYRNSQGVLVVYDISDRESFIHLEGWLDEAKRRAVDNAAMVVVGTKSDLTENRQVQYEEGKNFAANHGLKFVETSSKTAENIEECFEILAKSLLNKWRNGEIHYDDPMKDVHITTIYRNDNDRKTRLDRQKQGCGC
eukprot:TRINITY_DN5727_c0_g2_i1.p1 TRINITY_DN5727_c0_g2~~TRINITY_DN5727_c0_g2_i1.p1  ORF type:complete len:510 (-),score=109.64 TRINITY_DN5727_c0_g2_i1:162-1691(-)